MLDISLCCKARTQPLRSIGLKQIDHNMPIHQFQCPCEMCNFYQANKVHEILQARTVSLNRKIQSRVNAKAEDPQKVFGYYKSILKYLILPHNKIIARGLNIFIPQIVFYKDGEANSLFISREVDDPAIKRANRQKISVHFIQKILGDRRKKYRQMVQGFLGKKKVVVQKKPLFGRKKPVKKEAKDAVIIRYINGHEQLITESQFSTLMQLRKQDPKWKQIAYIRNCISVDDPNTKLMAIRFNEEDIKYQQLFERSKTLMGVYAQNIMKGDKNYISDEEEDSFCKALANESTQIYGEYLLYKIVSFIQKFHDEKVKKISVKFLVNQLGQAYLQDVFKLEKQVLVKYTWTNATYEKKISEHQQKVIYSKNIHVTDAVTKNAQKIQKVLGQKYEGLKDQYGLLNVQVQNFEEIANNQFFKKLYPDVEESISDLLKEPNMTVDKFRKTYLGFKPTKKPIVRPFTCNMIRSLHKITPQLRGASPHHYISAPKQRTVSTAWSSHSGSKLRRSNFTKGNTTSFGHGN